MINEIVLPCGCHKVNSNGEVLTLLEQFSTKGRQGIQTRIGTQWRTLNTTTRRDSRYSQVCIHGKLIRVNRLVAGCFIANPNNLPEVHHKNGIRADNRVDNLEWGTAQTNADDRDRHGNTQRGVQHGLAKLDDEKVRLIRHIRATTDRTLLSIARQFNVSKKLILLIVHHRIWKHVT